MSLEGTAESTLLKGKLTSIPSIPSIDKTLTKDGECADAKATGEAITKVGEEISEISEEFSKVIEDSQKTFVKTVNGVKPDESGNVEVSGGSGTGEDTIVAQGTSGGWSYRKWASGFAECWLYESTTIKSSAWTELTPGVFAAGSLPFQTAYPFAFTAAPSEIAVMHTKFVMAQIISQSMSPAFATQCGLYRAIHVGANAPTMDVMVGISLYVSGRWE